MSLKSAAALSVAVLLSAGAAAHAEIIHFAATLSGAEEVPPNSSAGRGEVSAELETSEHTLVYRATYSGLTGPATAAHFHGPAARGANAPPVLPVAPPDAPISGAVLLTEQQAEDLLAGRWYFNVHTRATPGGEIRGQLTRIN